MDTEVYGWFLDWFERYLEDGPITDTFSNFDLEAAWAAAYKQGYEAGVSDSTRG